MSDRPNSDPAARAERINLLFRAQFRSLAALFPHDGEAFVVRARAQALNAARMPHLRNASPESIAEKTIACMALGLEIGDQASLVPYGSDVQLIVGPRGLIALAYRGGSVKSIEARSVFESDFFEYELGDQGRIRHRKATQGRRPQVKDERGQVRDVPVVDLITHAYVVIETTENGKIREVLTAEDLDFYRSFSKAKTGPWFDNFEGMARKTVIKRGLEFVPRSALLSAALRETGEGGYEVPEEIWAAIRGKDQPPVEAPDEVEQMLARAQMQTAISDEEAARAIDQGRA